MKQTGFSEITIDRLHYTGTDPWYCEIAITGKCNFSCKYCNRFNADVDINLLNEYLTKITQFKHIQITGGEPTVHPDFFKIMKVCRAKTVKLGLSTNGTFGIDNYLKCEADMFSISLDDYDLDILKSRGYKNPESIIETIKTLSKTHYVNVGLVIDSLNVDRIESIIDYIIELGVNDIKLSTSTKDQLIPTFTKSYEQYPILNYRVNRFKNNLQMRGNPCKTCGICQNDVTIVGDKHYPCLVYFREKGEAIGTISDTMMEDRDNWSKSHDCMTDPICKAFCMDFKCEFNNALADIK